MSRRQRHGDPRHGGSGSHARTRQRRVTLTKVIVVVGVAGVVALLAAVTWGGVLAPQRSWSPPTIADELVVGRVHGEPVAWAQVAERMKAATVMGRPAPADLRAWREEARQTIEAVIGEVLTRHFVEGQGVVVTEAMIDAEVRKVEEQYGGQDGLASAMSDMQVTMAEFRETQRRGLYLQALIDRIVPASEADIDAYLAQPGAAGMSRTDAAARVRAERAAEVIPGFLADLRRDPMISVIDMEELE